MILSLKIPPGSVVSRRDARPFQYLFCALPKEMAKVAGFACREYSK
jgi:hypothetical protein